MIRVVEWSSTYIDKTVECPVCGKKTVYIGSIGDDYTLTGCDNCDRDYKAYLTYDNNGSVTLHLKDYETDEVII